MEKFSLEGQVGIVTGGGAGLGRGYCRECARAGATIVVADIDSETGREMARELTEAGRDALFVQTDVCSRDSIEAMTTEVLAKYGKIDFLINNAGMWLTGGIETTTEVRWNQVMDLNINGLFACCQIVGKQMIAQGGGRIINVSSISGVIINEPQPVWLEPAYFASKAAVIHLTKGLAAEWAQHNIRANVICPGYMANTPYNPEVDRPPWVDSVPLRRPGRPDELGTVAVFLASEASSYVTGAVIMVDGGFTIH
ncbi:MAG: SDR family oxidoreductase [Spirochaetales bacterium]|nr:SDR family oxidoreductase [Spirochaetales bacterium]